LRFDRLSLLLYLDKVKIQNLLCQILTIFFNQLNFLKMKSLKKEEVKQLLEKVKLISLTTEQLVKIKGGTIVMGKPDER
jgi:hypothetical protein